MEYSVFNVARKLLKKTVNSFITRPEHVVRINLDRNVNGDFLRKSFRNWWRRLGINLLFVHPIPRIDWAVFLYLCWFSSYVRSDIIFNTLKKGHCLTWRFVFNKYLKLLKTFPITFLNRNNLWLHVKIQTQSLRNQGKGD
jgi:hypothetical protein